MRDLIIKCIIKERDRTSLYDLSVDELTAVLNGRTDEQLLRTYNDIQRSIGICDYTSGH